MLTPCRRSLVLSAFFLFAILAAAAAQPTGGPFPFGSELMLDAAPMHGSKRVPMLEIENDGSASIDLWCTSLNGHATVGDGTIAIVPGEVDTTQPPVACDPERQSDDAALLTALTQATNWRREGDAVELSGATPLRYRLMTN